MGHVDRITESRAFPVHPLALHFIGQDYIEPQPVEKSPEQRIEGVCH